MQSANSISTAVNMLGHRSGLVSCIVSLRVLGLSLTISYPAFHFVVDAVHLASLLGTPRPLGNSPWRHVVVV